MDLYLLNELNKLEAGGSSSATSTTMFPSNQLLVEAGSTDNKFCIPAVTHYSSRYGSIWHNYSSGFGGTTYYTYSSDAHSRRIRFWMPSGSVRKDASVTTELEGSMPAVIYAKNNKVLTHCGYGSAWNGSSYAPQRGTVMFIKNKGTTSKTITVYGQFSSQYSSGHDGSSMDVWMPNSATKSAVTSLSVTTSTYSGTTANTNFSQNVTIPAGYTIAVVLTNSMYYHQDTNSWASWHDYNGFYNLQTTFSDADIVPDYEMTQTYLMGRHYTTSYSQEPHKVWNMVDHYFPPAAGA